MREIAKNICTNEVVNPSHQQAMANLDLISEVLATNREIYAEAIRTAHRNYTQNNATNGNDAMRAKAVKSLSAEIERMGVTAQEVSAIAGVKFGKTSTKDMTTNEICDLTNNLESWIMEQSA